MNTHNELNTVDFLKTHVMGEEGVEKYNKMLKNVAKDI
jgi:hypothetical protein